MHIYAPQPLQAPSMRTMLTAVGGDDECSSDCDPSLEECSTPIQRLLRTLNISPPGPTSDDLRRSSPSTESFTASECFRASEGASTPESFRHHFQRPTTNQPPVQINSLDPGWMHPCPQPLLFGSLPNGLLPCTMNFLDHPARNDFAAMGFGSQVPTSATPNKKKERPRVPRFRLANASHRAHTPRHLHLRCRGVLPARNDHHVLLTLRLQLVGCRLRVLHPFGPGLDPYCQREPSPAILSSQAHPAAAHLWRPLRWRRDNCPYRRRYARWWPPLSPDRGAPNSASRSISTVGMGRIDGDVHICSLLIGLVCRGSPESSPLRPRMLAWHILTLL
ncbi:hypothetical protein B0H14DRAFT_978484 [Mycena olivaceomarginata]|nr:hypothetical protein B0H14DRAFT_978484 [Mycena olivaceomarginata]